MWQLQLYVGLGVFCGYVLFDTQMIVEKAAGGDKDHIKHALELFIDFVEIFYRLVIILMKNAQEKNREDKLLHPRLDKLVKEESKTNSKVGFSFLLHCSQSFVFRSQMW